MFVFIKLLIKTIYKLEILFSMALCVNLSWNWLSNIHDIVSLDLFEDVLDIGPFLKISGPGNVRKVQFPDPETDISWRILVFSFLFALNCDYYKMIRHSKYHIESQRTTWWNVI